ncbi:MAG: hypothetical protein PHH26_06140 [Candidatus Thermoplasmatota archaeon]|nr:hypothetical protein [Candidatus Thermoplasmatota archaeon]
MKVRGFSRDAKGQLLLLAGILIILAFVSISITVQEIAGLGSRTVREESKPAMLEDYAVIRTEFGKALNASKNGASGPVSNATFRETVNSSAASFEKLEAGSGITFRAFLAGNGTGSDKNEWNFVSLGEYIGTSINYDKTSDGIVYNSASGHQRIEGAIIYIYIADEKNEIFETIFYKFY